VNEVTYKMGKTRFYTVKNKPSTRKRQGNNKPSCRGEAVVSEKPCGREEKDSLKVREVGGRPHRVKRIEREEKMKTEFGVLEQMRKPLKGKVKTKKKETPAPEASELGEKRKGNTGVLRARRTLYRLLSPI